MSRTPGKMGKVPAGSSQWINPPPAAGRLLVSAPALVDAPFARSVVYLLEHDGGGTVGVILNQPSRTPVGQVLPDWQDVVSEPAVIFAGGPVMPDGALCLGELRGGVGGSLERPGIRQVFRELATVDLDADVALVTAAAGRMRVFAGHAGWAPGQLADELAAGAWYVVPGSADDVFSADPTPLWRRVLRRQPAPLNLLSTYPPDAAMN
jgi:putative transcriptional regulator